jgi:hypothetical protein
MLLIGLKCKKAAQSSENRAASIRSGNSFDLPHSVSF